VTPPVDDVQTTIPFKALSGTGKVMVCDPAAASLIGAVSNTTVPSDGRVAESITKIKSAALSCTEMENSEDGNALMICEASGAVEVTGLMYFGATPETGL